MSDIDNWTTLFAHHVGRPRRGTGLARSETLLNAATRVFLRDGYGQASLARVAAEAGVSTRTIYARFKNKAELFRATIDRLVDRMNAGVAAADLNELAPRQGLMCIARAVTARARDPEAAALFRIIATEAHRFPQLAASMRESETRCVYSAVADYLRRQVEYGNLVLPDPARAAKLFLRLVLAEIHETWLFGGDDKWAQSDNSTFVAQVVDLFLLGALPRFPSTYLLELTSTSGSTSSSKAIATE